MALSPHTAQSPSLPVDDPADLVSARLALTAADESPVADAGAECGGDGSAKWQPGPATSLLEDEMDDPGVVGVAGDCNGPEELATHCDGSLYHHHTQPTIR